MYKMVLHADPVKPLSRVTINVPYWPFGLAWNAVSLLAGTGCARSEGMGVVEQPVNSIEESASSSLKRIVSLSIRDSK